MADGPYRYAQPVGQQFFYPQTQQNHPQRHQPRNGSPIKIGRANTGFASDTPSPTRSPGTQSPALNIFGMYNQGHQQGQHPMMNGAPTNRGYGMQMNMTHNFKPQQLHHHQQPHGQQHHHHPQQQDPSHQMHGVVGHQHTFSGAGLSNATPHFTPGQMQNGTQANPPSGANKVTDHWATQLQLAQESRQASSPHHYARVNAHTNKGVTSNSVNSQRRENGEERNRTRQETEKRGQNWMSLDIGGQGIRTLSPALFNYTFLDKLYLNYNKLTRISSAIGRLKSLSHLDISHNQLSELPPEIGMLVNLKTLLLFDNNLHALPHEMGALYQLETLGIEGNPLEEDLKHEMMDHGTKALITHLRETAPVTLPPSQRDWIVLDETVSSSGPPPEKLTVLAYNTLCDRYATSNQYGYAPSLALSWDYRKELILQEVRAQNADIVCMQEVAMESYSEYFRPQLAYDDYKGVFWPKSRAKTMAENEAKAVDGCATLYKGHKYILLDKQVIEFANTAINRPDMKGEEDVYNRVMPRDHIAVITFLENRLTGSRVIVVNAHIFWDPEYTDVKVVQVGILMDQVSKLADKYAKWPPCTDKTIIRPLESGEGNEDFSDAQPGPSVEYSTGSQIPLILCTDLNSQPGSGVYDLLANGTLPNNHPDLADRTYGNFTRDGMAHPFSLKSSYATIGELSFTNYTPGFMGVIDYIWYSTNALQVTGLLGEVDKEYLQRVPGFPNYHFPSDHLALLVEFIVKPRKDPKRGLIEPDFGSSSSSRDRRDQQQQ